MLSKLRNKLKSKKKNDPVQNCPLQKGNIVVIVRRSDNDKEISGVQVKLQGPTPGQEATGEIFGAPFYDRIPGGYRYELISFPANHEHFNYEENDQPVANIYQGSGSVVANDNSFYEVLVYPTGDLEVNVYVEDKNKSRSLIPKAEIDEILARGPQSQRKTKENAYTFSRIQSGKYDVSAAVVDDTKYVPASDQVKDVVVPEGGKGVAEIVLALRTWIKVRVYDKDENQDLANVSVKFKSLDGTVDESQKTDGSGLCEWKMKHIDGDCGVQALTSDGEEVYEVVDVEEI